MLGPQYTGQRKAKEILAIVNSFDILVIVIVNAFTKLKKNLYDYY